MSALRDISATSFCSANLIKEALLPRQNSPFKRAFSAKWLVKMETNYFESWNHFPPYCAVRPLKIRLRTHYTVLSLRNFALPRYLILKETNLWQIISFLFLEGVAQEQKGWFLVAGFKY
ncbi:hypothetical protein CEXT_227061 [Caerostris extrusa]|uniref:Uncharacterized protein n=1 Tax=Caerostris extrusa TaxID=172846 RepID=A0AAV4NCX8_CAEEX|nr:hypothetical protein CEXT_227061 [Caerostris extrusa]